MKISAKHGRNKVKLDNTALTDYLKKNNFPIVTKEYKKYLLYEGIQDHHVYILKSGVIKTSVISRDGREFNLESEKAELYQIDRVEFWKDINQNFELQIYVKNYYRERLLKSMKRTQQMLMNGKFGAVCTQIYDLYDKFGVELDDGVLIDFIVTNEEIAHFCGINAASSVSRIMHELKSCGAIQMINRKILIKNIELIKDNIIF